MWIAFNLFSNYWIVIFLFFSFVKTRICRDDLLCKAPLQEGTLNQHSYICPPFWNVWMVCSLRHTVTSLSRWLSSEHITSRHGWILFQLLCGGYSQTPCQSMASFLLRFLTECYFLPQSNCQKWVQVFIWMMLMTQKSNQGCDMKIETTKLPTLCCVFDFTFSIRRECSD